MFAPEAEGPCACPPAAPARAGQGSTRQPPGRGSSLPAVRSRRSRGAEVLLEGWDEMGALRKAKVSAPAVRPSVRAFSPRENATKATRGSTPRLTLLLWQNLPGWSLSESSVFVFEFDEIKS